MRRISGPSDCFSACINATMRSDSMTRDLTEKARLFARRYLPTPVRKAFGILCGKCLIHLVYPSMGLLFDLLGGRFRADGCQFIIPKDVTSREFRACFLTG